MELQPIELKMEALKTQYPEGLFVYFQPDRLQHERLREIFAVCMPGRLPIITAIDNGAVFPTDWGKQIGSVYYGRQGLYDIIIHELTGRSATGNEGKNQHPLLPIDDSETQAVMAYLPPRRGENETHRWEETFMPSGGGHIVPIANSRLLVTGFFRDYNNEEKEILAKSDLWYYWANRLRWANLSLFALSKMQESIHNGHIDLVMTGMSTPDGLAFHVDEKLVDRMGTIMKHEVVLPGTIKSYPHELTVAGGLNILYAGNFAFMLSERTAEPLISDIQAAGLSPVFLGEDQFAFNGGIKCRSAMLSWRK